MRRRWWSVADIYLKHFDKSEILISPGKARTILRFFFGNAVPAENELNDDDVAFAQALLLEAIDKSYAMGYVQAIFDSFYMKIPDDVSAMVKDFVKAAAKNWFDHATGKDMSNPKIYDSVRAMIRANFRTTWAIRMQGGGLTY
jgi:hypothetical protein